MRKSFWELLHIQPISALHKICMNENVVRLHCPLPCLDPYIILNPLPDFNGDSSTIGATNHQTAEVQITVPVTLILSSLVFPFTVL